MSVSEHPFWHDEYQRRVFKTKRGRAVWLSLPQVDCWEVHLEPATVRDLRWGRPRRCGGAAERRDLMRQVLNYVAFSRMVAEDHGEHKQLPRWTQQLVSVRQLEQGVFHCLSPLQVAEAGADIARCWREVQGFQLALSQRVFGRCTPSAPPVGQKTVRPLRPIL